MKRYIKCNRRFRDTEDGFEITEDELRKGFELQKSDGEIDDEVTFEGYLSNCLGKNGFLEEIDDATDASDPYHGYRWYCCNECGYESFHPMDEDDGMCPSCYDHHGGYGMVDPDIDPEWYEDINPEWYKTGGVSRGGRPEYDRDIFRDEI